MYQRRYLVLFLKVESSAEKQAGTKKRGVANRSPKAKRDR